ncbi:MAG: FAD-dependent oxidoreductase [Myxococcales bacterium]|nr:MAG: FAD-dependent oxidoreductase [Myxococcales bacterium]
MKASEVSPWLSEVVDHASPLVGDIDADVVIVGGGFSGLSTALELRAAGLDVVLLESRFAGFGASGRNAGHLTPTIGKDLPTLTRIYGEKRVRGLARLSEVAIGYVETLLRVHDINCDYQPVGNVVAATHPLQYANLDRAATVARKCGVPGEILEPGDMRARGLPASFRRDYFEPHGGILDPGRYVMGLRHAVLRAGTRLYERTPLVRIDNGQPVVAHTPRGSVRARHLVIATNAYTSQLGLLRSRVLPSYVQLFRTEPLGAEQRRSLDWHGREGIYTAHEMLESYRLTRDGRIVGGAKHVRYGFGSRVLTEPDGRISTSLEKTFRARFPELRNLRITDHWGGPIAFALDFLPVVGRMGRKQDVLYAVGYAGHGVAIARYAGRMIADLLLEREGPGEPLWSRRVLPLPPEPLRWLVVQLLTRFFARIDRRVDESPPASPRSGD